MKKYSLLLACLLAFAAMTACEKKPAAETPAAAPAAAAEAAPAVAAPAAPVKK